MNFISFVTALFEQIEPQFDRELRDIMATPDDLEDPNDPTHAKYTAPVETPLPGDLEKGLQPWTDIKSAVAAAKLGVPVLTKLLNRCRPPNSRIKLSIKPPTSIVNKLQRFEEKQRTIRSIHDVLRCTVMCGDSKGVETTLANLKRYGKVLKVEKKEDNDPNADLSTLPKDDPRHLGYFGSYHLDLLLGVSVPNAPADSVEGIITEVQVMTRRLQAFKKVGHKLYDKHRNPDAYNYDRQKKNLPPIPAEKMQQDFQTDTAQSRHLYKFANAPRASRKPGRMRADDDLDGYF